MLFWGQRPLSHPELRSHPPGFSVTWITAARKRLLCGRWPRSIVHELLLPRCWQADHSAFLMFFASLPDSPLDLEYLIQSHPWAAVFLIVDLVRVRFLRGPR